MRHAFFFARRIRRNAQTRTRLACAYHPEGSAGAKQSASAYFAKSARDKKNHLQENYSVCYRITVTTTL